MRYIVTLLLVVLFVSCKGGRCLENDFKESFSIDGEYHPVDPDGWVASKPYFQIAGNGYVYYQAGLGNPPPIKGTITKLANSSYLFNSEYQDSKLNYEKYQSRIDVDSVAIDFRFYSGMDMEYSDWSFILKNGEVVPFSDRTDMSKTISLPLAFVNQIEWIYSRYFRSWKLNDYISVFEGGCHYNILLMDDDNYFVMKNAKVRIVNDTLFWYMEHIDDTIEAMYIKK